MALGLCVICLIAVFTRNAQAIIAEDSQEDDLTFKLELGEQPWLSLLELPGGVFCSGTIVSPTSILSAALCLQGVTHPTHGVAYAGNVKYREPKDFVPPTQNRSVVEYHLYDENNTLVYNIMVVKIFPKWTWSGSVQPIGVINMERLSENFTSPCYVSGLGHSYNGDNVKVARSANVWMSTWRACAPSPQDQRMCYDDSGILAPRAGDLGGPILCDYEPVDKLYGIISEHGKTKSEELLDSYKIPSHVDGFQFVGYYLSWINKTAGDLLSDEEVKTIRRQHEKDFPLPVGMNGLFPVGRKKHATDENAGTGVETVPGTQKPDTVAGNADDAPVTTTAAPSGAGGLCAGFPALLLAAALRALC